MSKIMIIISWMDLFEGINLKLTIINGYLTEIDRKMAENDHKSTHNQLEIIDYIKNYDYYRLINFKLTIFNGDLTKTDPKWKKMIENRPILN